MEKTKELELPADVAKKFADELQKEDLTPKQRAAKLQELMKEHMPNANIIDEAARNADMQIGLFNITDEQLDKVLEKAAGNGAEAVKALADHAQRKHDMDAGSANAAAGEVLEKHIHKKEFQKKSHPIIADFVRGMAGAMHGKPFNAQEIYERESEVLGRESRTITEGTDADGGYQVPELWSTEIYIGLAQTSIARRHALVVEVEGHGSVKIPKITAGLTGRKLAELTDATVDKPTWAQLELDPQKVVAMTDVFSHEMFVKANPAIIPVLTKLAVIALGRKESEIMFVGADSGFDGILENTTNNVYLGNSSTSGMTAITDTTFDDMANLENALDEHYVPDEDVQHAMGINGSANYYFNKALANVLAKEKGNDNYHWKRVEEGKNRMIHGYNYHRVIDMPSAPSTNTAFAAFLNPSFYYLATHPGIYVDLLKEGTVNSVNMATAAGMALRFIEYIDGDLVDDNASAVLSTAAS